MGARAFDLSGSENNLIKVKKLTPGYDLGLKENFVLHLFRIIVYLY